MKRYTIQIIDNEKNAVVVKEDTDCIIGAYSKETDMEKKRTKVECIVRVACCVGEVTAVIDGAEDTILEAKRSVVKKAVPSVLEQMLDKLFDSLERFARENYMMHTDKEDVYLVEP